MIFYAISATIAGIICFAIAGWIWTGKRNYKTKILTATVASIGVWLISNMASDLVSNVQLANSMLILTSLSSSFVVSCFLIVAILLLTNKNQLSARQTLIILVPAIIISILTPTGLIYHGLNFESLPRTVIYGPLYSTHLLHLGLYPLAGYILLAAKTVTTRSKQQRRNLLLFLTGSLLAIGIPFVTVGILPLLGNPSLLSVGAMSAVLFLPFMLYPILNDRFLDVKLMLSRSFFRAIIIFSLTTLYLLLLFLISLAVNHIRQELSIGNLSGVEIVNVFALILPLVASLLLGTYIAIKHKTPLRRMYAVALITLSVFLALNALQWLIPPTSLALQRAPYFPVALLPIVTFLIFYLIVFDKYPSKAFLLGAGLFATAFLILSQTSLFLTDVVYTENEWTIIYGPLYTAEALYHAIFVGSAFYLVAKNWKKLKEKSKKILKILIPTFFLAFSIPIVSNVLSPAFGFRAAKTSPIGSFVGISIFIIGSIIAIQGHNLIDARTTYTRKTIRALLTGVLLVVLTPVVFWLLFVGPLVDSEPQIRAILFLLVLAALYPLFSFALEKFVDRLIFSNATSPLSAVSKISKKLSQLRDIKQITKILVEDMVASFNLRGAAFYQLKNENAAQIHGVNFSDQFNFHNLDREGKGLLNTLKEQSFTVVSDLDEASFPHLTAKLKDVFVEILIPIRQNSEIIGVLILKEKRLNEAFTREDFEAFGTLAYQIETSIKNAELFEQTRDFANTLQEEISKATQELQKQNAQLQTSQKVRSEFFADVSHELKTPLTIMQGNLDGVDGKIDSPQKAAIDRELQRINKLTSELLDLSKAESGVLRLITAQFNIEVLCKDVVQQLKSIALQKDVTVYLMLQAKGDIKADEEKIERLITNLITNAIKYNKEGGTVTVSTEQDGKDLVLEVSDTGIGIPEKDLPHIFERFYRVDKQKSRQEGGTGLGLSIVKLIVDLHGGSIDVKSKEGEGTTFTVRLPRN